LRSHHEDDNDILLFYNVDQLLIAIEGLNP